MVLGGDVVSVDPTTRPPSQLPQGSMCEGAEGEGGAAPPFTSLHGSMLRHSAGTNPPSTIS